MNKFLFSLLIALSLAMTIPALESSDDFRTPDFAYPQTVITEARAMLERADGPEAGTPQASALRLRALLELYGASTAIDPDSATAFPAIVAAEMEHEHTAAGKAMLLNLQAQILHDIYNEDRWKFDQVSAPAEPLPDSPELWSGEQFKARIVALGDDAIAAASESETPLTVYAACLEYNPEALVYIPTVADYVRACAVDRSERDRQRADSLISNALAAGTEGSASYIYWLWRRDAGNSQALLADYRRFEHVEPARLLLDKLTEQTGYIRSARYYDYAETASEDTESGENNVQITDDLKISLIEASLSEFPDWSGNASLRNTLAQLKRPRIAISCPSLIATGKLLPVTVNYAFADSIAVDIYRLPADDSYAQNSDSIAAHCPHLASVAILPDSVRGKRTVELLPVEEPGRYAIIGSINNIRQLYPSIVNVSPLIGFVVNCGGTAAAISTDFTSGKPLGGVSVYNTNRNINRRDFVTELLGRTDRKGILSFTPEQSSNTLSFKYQGYTYKFNDAVRFYRQPDPTPAAQRRAVMMTDRAIYHPGDTMAWAVVCGVRNEDGTTGVLQDKKLTVRLYDANYTVVDTCSVHTDALGRAYGTFAIPRGRLTGSYQLRTEDSDVSAAASVTVSDYRMPVFEIADIKIERDVPARGDVRISGRAVTYSGMAVAGAHVSADVLGANRLRWFMPSRQLGTLEATTDENGNFSIDANATFLSQDKGDGIRFHDFIANITVTSATAETARTSCNFTTGRPYVLECDGGDMVFDMSAAPATLIFKAYNAQGENVPVAVKWRLGKAGDDSRTLSQVLAEGSATTGTPCLFSPRIAAGRYSLEIIPVDTTLADTRLLRDAVVLYNTSTGDVPDLGSPLFIPQTDFTTDDKADIRVGIATEEAYVYIVRMENSHIVSTDMRRLDHGFHNIKEELPSEGNATVAFITVADGEVSRIDTYVRRKPEAPLTVTASSFRDRLTPGDEETWTFRLSEGSASVPAAGMIATMYNHALDALRGYSKPHGFDFYTPANYLALANPNISKIFGSAQQDIEAEEETGIQWPEMLFIQHYYHALRYALVGSARMSKNMSLARSMDMTDAAPMASLAAGAEAEEYAADADSGNSEADAPAGDFDYRDAEVPVAFFRPALTSDADGNIDITFTVPNANATWAFEAFAWTAGLKNAGFDGTAVTSKPVMVQPMLPRFLRQGDKATVAATVFNNTDSETVVSTTVELFDLTDGNILSARSFTDTIAAGASAIVSTDINAATDATAIGYRIRSTAGTYSDGEQSAIPILASAQTVVESTEFYLNPNQSEPFTLDMDVRPDTRYTLQYCQNPLWTIVKAMRGIAANDARTSTLLSSRLFSLLAGRHVAAKNPAIGEAVAQWQANPDEGALRSMLERNDDLKALILDQTPWLQYANNEAARMATLADLFDEHKSEAAIESVKEKLDELQNNDGGFAWASWSEQSSRWATETVLMHLGLARSLGMLEGDNSFDSMIMPAMRYLERCVTAPDMPDTDRNFALICALLPDYTPGTAAQALIERTCTRMAAGWRNESTVGKAYTILVLAANGKQQTAAQILQSIRQFGVVRAGMGMCYPSVDDIRGYATIIQAYTVMGAPADELDAMRQWILVRAQATDDLGTYNPDYVIAAVLLTGSDWTAPAVNHNVRVNGSPLAIGNVESATGYFAQALPTANSSVLNISIQPNGVTPSYGSVVSVGTRPMREIAARPGRDLSISKRLLVQRGGQWVETDSFTLGERVRVQLTIEARRDLEYVTITDQRGACLEPVQQLPGYVYDGSLAFYRENGDAATNIFIGWLPAGAYHVSYDMTASVAGSFIAGIATLQSQYAPELTAHSGGSAITVEPAR